MRKLVIGLAVALGLTGAGAVGPVQARDPLPDPVSIQVSVARSISPAVGRYRGHDQQDRLITFTYTRAHGIRHFRINHHLVGRATVSDGAFGRTCRHGRCVWGRWRSDTHVSGHWLRLDTGTARLGRRSGEPVSFNLFNIPIT
jgi:hypothetical protein